jgi:hypothetical protein
MTEFYEVTPTLDNYWRAIVLFGRNVASYKFALAQSLLQFKGRGNDLIRLEELARPFSQNICEHLAHSPKQGTSSSSKFLDGCREHIAGRMSQRELDGFVTNSIALRTISNGAHRQAAAQAAMRHAVKA